MSTSTVNLNIRMEKKLKEQLDELCKELGLTTSTAINIFAKAMVRKQALPFKLSLNTENKKTLKAIQNVEAGKNLSRKFKSVDELIEDLNA
ncbi:type II toxin-antitoxin system RelB/DinJ family antitoxin [uncultured Phascolarctobacterium sp.]|uniref:type II toxin-antitoxin system RelB/DinJ family antitoxin n=1 Tax=uncultured Phascolarctobacterium sp. TaxID=512296 RepID=UPI0025E29F55|nr:type II toxin-antitoxin system RelB/DinJ family antitoxin [uncultured Phascolarctobacterium sp.]